MCSGSPQGAERTGTTGDKLAEKATSEWTAVWAAHSGLWRRPAAPGKSLGKGALGEVESQ